VKYGVTTDYVLGLEVVLPDGTAVRLGGARLKDVAGLSLTKLFVGSEGTLGVITEATLRLIPAQPAPSTLAATFPSTAAATAAILAITALVRPAMLELMDRVGRLKTPWLADQLGPDASALTWRIKNALDPLGILNPGAALPPLG
jgi:FAD/FMN-containing dehydrogenase